MKNHGILLFAVWMLGPAAGCADEDSSSDTASEDTAADDAEAAEVPADPADADAGDPDGDETADPCDGHCENGIRDCGETGVDCGGGGCPTCDVPLVSFGEAFQTPNVAALSGDRVMVVWSDAVELRITYACFDGVDWTAPAHVYETGGGAEYPRLSVDSTGTFHLVNVHAGGSGSRIRYASYSMPGCGGAWQEGGFLDTEDYTPTYDYRSGIPNIDVDENDRPWAVWTEDDFQRIHLSRWTGTEWTAPVEVSETTEDNSDWGDIAVAGTTAAVVWQESRADRHLAFREGDGSAWSPIESIGDFGYFKNTQMDATGSGNLYVFSWQNGVDLYFRARIDGAWMPDWMYLAHAGVNEWASIKARDEGMIYGAWLQDVDGEGTQVFFSEGAAATGAWNEARRISPGPNPVFDPFIDVDDEGYAHIVWVDNTPPLDDDAGTVMYAKVRYEDL